MPIAIRLDPETRARLSDGARRTPHNQQQLIRLTLRRHLDEVIQQETAPTDRRVTNIDPWPKGALAKAYRRSDEAWEKIESAAIAAQGAPNCED